MLVRGGREGEKKDKGSRNTHTDNQTLAALHRLPSQNSCLITVEILRPFHQSVKRRKKKIFSRSINKSKGEHCAFISKPSNIS